MQANLEQAKEVILRLPTEEFEKFDEWYEAEKRNKSKSEEKAKFKKYQIERYKKARKWLDENGEKYMNQWVCLEGDQLIAHGTDALEVHRKAIEQGIKSPFVHHIVEEPTHYIGGW